MVTLRVGISCDQRIDNQLPPRARRRRVHEFNGPFDSGVSTHTCHWAEDTAINIWLRLQVFLARSL